MDIRTIFQGMVESQHDKSYYRFTPDHPRGVSLSNKLIMSPKSPWDPPKNLTHFWATGGAWKIQTIGLSLGWRVVDEWYDSLGQ